ncbi:hypothetical protein HAZT_HAZT005351 [Hyalella azteca]|nr:hypothetical protein HAZT_HAZT005351 [Hyalella azteca]
MRLSYGDKVQYTYDPIQYASVPHCNYLHMFCSPKPASLMLLGMNPGPWGMAQTGVPFGHVGVVRDWLGVTGEVRKPCNEHPNRTVLGFSCHRSEVSGGRLWSLLKLLCCNNPSVLAKSIFLHNYCPLLYLTSTGTNVTPADLKAAYRRPLESLCDASLHDVVSLLGVTDILAVGNYACNGARRAVAQLPVKVHKLMHPSPRNPLANIDWESAALQQLRQAGLLDRFPYNGGSSNIS